MFEHIKEYSGSNPGPTSIVIAGVHGDEPCGVQALKAILPTLAIERGRVLFVIGNSDAIRKHVRFIDSNLNRLFRDADALSAAQRESAEYQRAQFLRTALDQADAVLDLHASTIPQSTPFLICEPHAESITSHLPMSIVVSGIDDVEPGGVDYYMNQRGGIGITAECGSVIDPASQQRATDCIFAFLRARGHLAGTAIPVSKQKHVHVYDLYLTKTSRFTLSKPYADFEPIPTHHIIGHDGDLPVTAPKESVILFAHDRNTVGAEAFLLGEVKKNDSVS